MLDLIKIGATPSLTLPSTLQQPVRSMFLQWIGAVRYAIKVINENSTLLSNYTLLLVEEDAKFEVSAALEGVNNLLSHHKMSVFLASPFNWLAQALYPTLAARRVCAYFYNLVFLFFFVCCPLTKQLVLRFPKYLLVLRPLISRTLPCTLTSFEQFCQTMLKAKQWQLSHTTTAGLI
jgi:hypothetical protein